jgi:hypothetical protein
MSSAFIPPQATTTAQSKIHPSGASRRLLLPFGRPFCLGLACTLVLTRFMQGPLYGVGVSDPWALGGAIVFLSLVTLVACGFPALRAMRVDPVTALRSE